jgi:protein-disulfide isomerase
VSYPICNPARRQATRLAAVAAAAAAVLPRVTSAQVLGAQSPSFEQFGSQPPSSNALLPYRVVHVSPFYNNRVLELFEFTCPYCRQVNDGARQWGGTLPKPFVFEQVPIVYDDATARAAGFYYLMLLQAPQKIGDYMDAVFTAVQDEQAPLTSNATFIRAAAQVGITEAQFRRALSRSKDLPAYIQRVAELCKKVAPKVTPTFVVNGDVTDVSYTRGDYQKLFKLLDGLVSQQLHRG